MIRTLITSVVVLGMLQALSNSARADTHEPDTKIKIVSAEKAWKLDPTDDPDEVFAELLVEAYKALDRKIDIAERFPPKGYQHSHTVRYLWPAMWIDRYGVARVVVCADVYYDKIPKDPVPGGGPGGEPLPVPGG